MPLAKAVATAILRGAYLMLHHALDLSFVETSLTLFLNAGLLTPAEVKAARREPSFVQIAEASVAAGKAGSRWDRLYAREASITGSPDSRVGDFIPTVLTSMTATAYFSRQLDALSHLQDRPTAALERVFAIGLQAQQDAIDPEDPTTMAPSITGIDGDIATFVATMRDLSSFAQQGTGTAAIFVARRRIYGDMQTDLFARIGQWDRRVVEFDAAIAAVDADAGADEELKFASLTLAERLIATEATNPLPALFQTYRDDLVDNRRHAFVAQRDTLAALGNLATLSGLHNGLDAERGAVADFDPEPLDLSGHATQLVTLSADMLRRAATLSEEITARLSEFYADVAEADAASDPRTRLEAQALHSAQNRPAQEYPSGPPYGGAPGIFLRLHPSGTARPGLT
ncbi:hypothetical protein JMM63_14060 [Rhodovulum sulfidophilum]|uniref:hypothetical protein n=1 Tax=Rhodovulum sulfidophilum TaxID=35806 RepID=UPI0019212B62|nr:hypothetical protein [Rhodovulum sulfidophilum]MBL3596675.1 hypothetical protein [Rhodovulum sulfidophilum]